MTAELLTADLECLVSLRDVESVLVRRMKALQGPGAAPVQRARMANLVIFCNGLEQAGRINGQIPEIEAVHPARALLVIGEAGGDEREVTARVTVRPLHVTGGRAHALVEQVTLHAAGAAVDRLPFAVRALLIGDLPTNLWWAAPQPPPLAGPLLHELSENAQQIMYDSIGWEHPVRGVAATASWLERIERAGAGGRWRAASDLQLAAAKILAAAANASGSIRFRRQARPKASAKSLWSMGRTRWFKRGNSAPGCRAASAGVCTPAKSTKASKSPGAFPRRKARASCASVAWSRGRRKCGEFAWHVRWKTGRLPSTSWSRRRVGAWPFNWKALKDRRAPWRCRRCRRPS